MCAATPPTHLPTAAVLRCAASCRSVHTMALPVVTDLIELYKASDAGATAALLAKLSVERSYSAKLDDVRMGVSHAWIRRGCVACMSSWLCMHELIGVRRLVHHPMHPELRRRLFILSISCA